MIQLTSPVSVAYRFFFIYCNSGEFFSFRALRQRMLPNNIQHVATYVHYCKIFSRAGHFPLFNAVVKLQPPAGPIPKQINHFPTRNMDMDIIKTLTLTLYLERISVSSGLCNNKQACQPSWLSMMRSIIPVGLPPPCRLHVYNK